MSTATIRRRRRGQATPQVITSSVAPTMGALTDAQTPSAAFTSGTYASTAGTISSEIAAYFVNGVSQAGSFDLQGGETVYATETVTDSAANVRVFQTGSVVVTYTTNPAFTSGPTSASTAENTAVPFTVGTYAATQGATLSLHSGDTGKYSFDPATGVLTRTAALDFDTDASDAVVIRATNNGGLTADRTFTHTITNVVETVPSQFGTGDWSLADSPSAGGDQLTLTIISLPSAGDGTITALEYSIGGGAWTALTGTGTGARTITVPATTLASVQVRAVNAAGNGTASAAKTATPTVSNDLWGTGQAPTAWPGGGATTTSLSLAGSRTGTFYLFGSAGTWVETITRSAGTMNVGPSNIDGSAVVGAATTVGTFIGTAYSDRIHSDSEIASVIASVSGAGVRILEGPELISNGHFTTDLSGWTVISGNVSVVDAGRAKVGGGGSITGIYLEIPVTAAQKYVARGDIEFISGAGARIRITDGGGFVNARDSAIITAGSASVAYVVPTTVSTLRVLLRANSDLTATFRAYYDNVSVRLLTTDTSATTFAVALGGSSTSAYNGATAVLDLIDTTHSRTTLAQPGNTIAQQEAAWTAWAPKTQARWVGIACGFNDMNPAEAASAAIGRLQTLINTVRAGVGPTIPIYVSQLFAFRSRLINVYGATDGPIAHAKWAAFNEAIAGGGATPITGIDGIINAHLAPFNDGADNLAAIYDTGDGIHPNNAGRQIIADAWEAALTAGGVTI